MFVTSITKLYLLQWGALASLRDVGEFMAPFSFGSNSRIFDPLADFWMFVDIL